MADEPRIAAGVTRIAAGVMTAVHSESNPMLGEVLEAAMTEAVRYALAQGVNIYDSEKILHYKQIAYDVVMAQFDA